MKRVVLLIVVGVCLSVAPLSIAAADLPVVRQPGDPSYSVADRATLAAAWTEMEALLRPVFSLSRLLPLRDLSWGDSDYVQFAAGTLQSAGYATLLATGPWDGGATRTWILAGVPLSNGVGYIPVEAVPSALASSSTIGQVAWQGGATGTSFDSRYLRFAQAAPLAPNMPPAVALSIGERYAVVDVTTTFQVMGTDSDGGILGYIWTISDGTVIVDPRATLWYTFRQTGDATVTAVVLDTRGARTTLVEQVEVLAERPDCGCGKP
jgi:hypothetical protein